MKITCDGKLLSEMNLQEIQAMRAEIKRQVNLLIHQETMKFVVGMPVEWNSKKYGHHKGIVKSVGTKNIRVIAENGVQWIVSATLLKPIKSGE